MIAAATLFPVMLSFFIFIPLVLLVLAVFAFWLWMLVDCAVNEPSQGNDKIVWILVIIFTHFLGALIYFCARRPQRRRETVA